MPFVSLLCYLFIFLYFTLIFPTSWQPSISSIYLLLSDISWQDDLSYLNYIHWTYASFFCFPSDQVSSTIMVEYHEPNWMISSPLQLLSCHTSLLSSAYVTRNTPLISGLHLAFFLVTCRNHLHLEFFKPHSWSVDPPVWSAPRLAFGIDIGFLSCQVSQFEASNIC